MFTKTSGFKFGNFRSFSFIVRLFCIWAAPRVLVRMWVGELKFKTWYYGGEKRNASHGKNRDDCSNVQSGVPAGWHAQNNGTGITKANKKREKQETWQLFLRMEQFQSRHIKVHGNRSCGGQIRGVTNTDDKLIVSDFSHYVKCKTNF